MTTFSALPPKNLLALVLSSAGFIAAFGAIISFQPNTAHLHPAVLLIPLGLLLFSTSATVIRAVRWTIYAICALFVAWRAGVALAITVFEVPVAPHFAQVLSSPWSWIHLVGTTALTVFALVLTAELIRRVAEQPLRDGPVQS
jgi:hypothetical protein